MKTSVLPKRRTYWHLEAQRRVPTEYEVVTSKLLYYGARGFEVNVPLGAWYARHQQGSPLGCSDWERFADPRATTYARYVDLQQAQEAFTDGVLCTIDETDYDERLSADWVEVLGRVLGPLRYPLHGLQMAAAYVAQMAPSGRITVTAMMQAADEMRRVHHLAHRMAQLRRTVCGFGDDSRAIWQDDPRWQPLRELVERLLSCFDWGEALVALNVVAKPELERVLLADLGQIARRRGDPLLESLLLSFARDGDWHREWSSALLRMAIDDKPENQETVAVWVTRWSPLAARAATAVATLFDPPRSSPEVPCT